MMTSHLYESLDNDCIAGKKPNQLIRSFLTEDERWNAVRLRARDAHSSFVYAVKTTHIYCRPTCPSRLARRANVVFFNSAGDASAGGFRPCKRCLPEPAARRGTNGEEIQDSRRDEVVRNACEILKSSADGTQSISAGYLARRVGLSLRYFHTVFKEATGCTPAQYARRIKLDKESQANDIVADESYNWISNYLTWGSALDPDETHMNMGLSTEATAIPQGEGLARQNDILVDPVLPVPEYTLDEILSLGVADSSITSLPNAGDDNPWIPSLDSFFSETAS